jgi:hypothetical protein
MHSEMHCLYLRRTSSNQSRARLPAHILGTSSEHPRPKVSRTCAHCSATSQRSNTSTMVLKIRLARFGKKHAPFYNIVVAHARYAPPTLHLLHLEPPPSTGCGGPVQRQLQFPSNLGSQCTTSFPPRENAKPRSVGHHRHHGPSKSSAPTIRSRKRPDRATHTAAHGKTSS